MSREPEAKHGSLTSLEDHPTNAESGVHQVGGKNMIHQGK